MTVCPVISAVNQSLRSLYWIPIEGYTQGRLLERLEQILLLISTY